MLRNLFFIADFLCPNFWTDKRFLKNFENECLKFWEITEQNHASVKLIILYTLTERNFTLYHQEKFANKYSATTQSFI